MSILSIAILFFIIMESANVLIFYFWPDSRLGNGVGVFNAFHDSADEEQKTHSCRTEKAEKRLDEQTG